MLETALLPAAPTAAPQVAISTKHADAITDAIAKSMAQNTARAYRQIWRAFISWTTENKYPAMPAPSPVLAAYLTALAEQGKSLATLRQHAAAVRKAHKAAGYPPPDAETVKAVIDGLRRRTGAAQRQASPLTAACLAAIRATAKFPRPGRAGAIEKPEAANRRGDMDIAIASVMRDGLLRVSEAAALVWNDVQKLPAGGGTLRIPRSKTDQAGSGVYVYIGAIALEALEKIRPEPTEPAASVFGLSASQIVRRIAAAAQAAGLEHPFSGHSPRVGMAQDLAAAGVELPALMQAGRWKDSKMPARYTERQALERGAVAQYYQRGR